MKRNIQWMNEIKITAMENKEIIKIKDDMGFHYEVTIEYFPHHGFSNAVYDGKIIGQVELNRINEPAGDDDREWELYEEMFGQWRCEIKQNITGICKEYFNYQLVHK